MKSLKYALCIAVAAFATATQAQAVVAASVAAATAVMANNHNHKQKETNKHRQQQDKAVTQIAQTGGLTVDADSGHVIIRCQWAQGGMCVIPFGKKTEGWFNRDEDLIITPQEFTKRQGYSKLYRITLLPLYDKDWLALEVSK